MAAAAAAADALENGGEIDVCFHVKVVGVWLLMFDLKFDVRRPC
jgi:hypothetical protein